MESLHSWLLEPPNSAPTCDEVGEVFARRKSEEEGPSCFHALADGERIDRECSAQFNDRCGGFSLTMSDWPTRNLAAQPQDRIRCGRYLPKDTPCLDTSSIPLRSTFPARMSLPSQSSKSTRPSRRVRRKRSPTYCGRNQTSKITANIE
jgi:hypothetical protein